MNDAQRKEIKIIRKHPLQNNINCRHILFQTSLNMEIAIANKYTVVKRIGQGAFGSVCKAVCLKTQRFYAAKLEMFEPGAFSLIKHEAAILHYLNSQKCTHIPYIYYYGIQTPYYCLVMTYYEGSLEELGSCLSMHEKMKWWNTMIHTLKLIHKAGIVHRDLKPAHFMRDSNQGWNLIDFGLATSFLKDGHQHMDETHKEHIVGSPNYVSFHVHEGKDVVPRDDFISLIYIFWELLYGSFLKNPFKMQEDTDFKKEHILHPYNQWLKDQKKWSRLYQLNRPDDCCSEMIIAVLIHGQFLKFKDKPSYDQFTFEINECTF